MGKKPEETIDSANDVLSKALESQIDAKVEKSLKQKILELAEEDIKKSAVTTDNKADGVKDAKLTGTSADPAKTPKKSNSEVDSSTYEARKSDDEDEDDEEEDKKKSKKMKKSEDEEEEDFDLEEEIEQVEIEDTEGLNKAFNDMRSEINFLRKGMTSMLELLVEESQKSEKRDGLNMNISKALVKIINDNAEMKKSVVENANLFKSITRMSGAPVVAGQEFLVKSEGEEATGEEVSETDKSLIMKSYQTRKISSETMRKALKGDTKALESVRNLKF